MFRSPRKQWCQLYYRNMMQAYGFFFFNFSWLCFVLFFSCRWTLQNNWVSFPIFHTLSPWVHGKVSSLLHRVPKCNAGSCSYSVDHQTILSKSKWKLILFNPLTPKISLVILFTVCYIVLAMLVWRIWYWIVFSDRT